MNGMAMIKSAGRNATTERPTARIEVRWLPVEALKPEKRNARVHSDRQVGRIADSIAAFGFNVPVLVDEKGGVLAGHGRVLAARRLKLEEVPTITLDHLTEAERRAFMIADNRLGELASWDDARLGLELEELKTLDLDFALSATGFELGEIDLRIEAVAALDSPSKDGRPSGRPMERGSAVNDRALQHRRQPPVVQARDAWTLGPHRLVCGDDSDAAAFLAVDAAIRRWQAVAGESARLDSTGETFASTARARRPSK
jgi:ParB-like chromosome segregation protein Spo0J